MEGADDPDTLILPIYSRVMKYVRSNTGSACLNAFFSHMFIL